MTKIPDREEELERLCLACIPPVILSNPNGWRMTHDDEYSESKAREESQRQVARNAEVIVEWVRKEAPRCLTALLQEIEADQKNRDNIHTYPPSSVAMIVATAARFVSPRQQADQQYDLVAWSESDRSLWICSENSKIADAILRSVSTNKGELPLLFPADVVDLIFQTYLRPLFSSTSSANINQHTGRARKQEATGHANQPMEEDIMWKGGDMSRARKTEVFGHKVVTSIEHDTLRSGLRHAGLGCEGVLYVCCQSLQARSHEGGVYQDVWTQEWPNVIPPLLQMLEDPSPRYRLIASRILAKTALQAEPASRGARQMSSLLRRTGISTLLLQNLEASLTFISHRLAGPLLQSTSEAWIRLVSITSEGSRDGGRARYEQLSRLMDQGVLRVWAYAPSTDAFEQVGGATDAVEVNDAIEASFIVLAELAQSDNLGVGIVRYLDVTLEYLTQQLFSTQSKVDRFVQRKEGNAVIPLDRELRTITAIQALVEASRDCPSLENWASRCITSLVRCWTVLQRAKIKSVARTELDRRILDALHLLRRYAAKSTGKCIARLLDLDHDFFAPLLIDTSA